ncbi:MAG: AmmeMemoRadiSam system protein B [Candidatus Rokuibacteriota bacterium]
MSGRGPRLRAIEVFPIDHEGKRYLALRDPAGFTPSVAMLPMALLEVVSLFDGEHSIDDIQAAVHRHTGERVERARITELAATLDEHGFLESARFHARRAAIEADFLASPVRPATHAGGAYAAEPNALRAAMDAFFTSADGPGPGKGRAGGAALHAVIAPHIDFHRGGPAYAWAYREVAERCEADVFVVFGTCHAGMADPFAMTRKAYDTPFGAAEVDGELVEAIVARAGQDCFASEGAHRGEHSIEFQAVFLRYLFAGTRDIRIVPVLTSFAHEALARGQRPEDDPRVLRFLDALADGVAATGRRVAFVAGADLAHVGPRFGDPEPVSAEDLAAVAREDREMLASVEAGDAAGFFDAAARDGDRRRICGLSPIWALLRATGGRTGVLRRYGQWPDPAAVVTYASVVF